MSKKKDKSIELTDEAKRQVAAMIMQVNQFLGTARVVLDVPQEYVTKFNEQGVPIGFEPKKED